MLLPGDADGLLDRLYALLGAQDDAFVVDLLSGFLDDLPGFLQRLADALGRGDFPALQRETHHLRSGAYALGGLGIAATALPLEAAARVGDAAVARVQLPLVVAEAEAFALIATALVERLRTP